MPANTTAGEMVTDPLPDLSAMHWPSATRYMSEVQQEPRTSRRRIAYNDSLEEAINRYTSTLALAMQRVHGTMSDDQMHFIDTLSRSDVRRAIDRHEQTPWRVRDETEAEASQHRRHLLDEQRQQMHQQHHQQQQQQALQQQSQQQAESSPRSNRLPNQHRVYLINCKHCGHFLTDRGMKAVLLLRPHITLYSTDAVPNCGPLYPPTSSLDGYDANEPHVERTCSCLTQTLGCYGCGSAVGYHIVSPCSRCTNSVAKHERSSNGHRTVLHCAEITTRERRYVPGERGVMTAPYPVPASSARTRLGSTRHDLQSQIYTRRGPQRRYSFTGMDLEADEDNKETYLPYDEVLDPVLRQPAPPPDPVISRSYSSSKEGKKPRLMKRGDTVYWSDLVMGGERHEPIDSDEILSMPVAGR